MAPYMSTHNGRVEHMHRTLMNKARTMQIYVDLPPYLWDEFYLIASYLHTWTMTHSLNGLTPFAQWYRKKPNLSHLCEIGCKAFVLIQDRNNPKIHERSIECTLIGYEPNAKAYRCYHRASGKVITSYHVLFIESHQIGLTPPHVIITPNPPTLPSTSTSVPPLGSAVTTIDQPNVSGYDNDDNVAVQLEDNIPGSIDDVPCPDNQPPPQPIPQC